jgi:hypothetical protein
VLGHFPGSRQGLSRNARALIELKTIIRNRECDSVILSHQIFCISLIMHECIKRKIGASSFLVNSVKWSYFLHGRWLLSAGAARREFVVWCSPN